MDKSGVVLGINELCLKAIGTTRDIIGKKPYAFYKKEIADHILEHNTEVIKREEILSQEEWIEDVTTKEVKCFSSVKAPLYDDEGRVIGIVGSSMEITAQKEAEQLRIKNEQLEFENKTHKLIVETQAKFQQIASQVAHDIRSPLASLLMLMKASEDIPEKERLAIRQAITTIEDIANNLLNQYKNESNLETESAQAILVSSLLLELITAKKYQYPHIQLTHEFSQAALFAFIHLDSTALKRAVSNIINNAVEALAGADKKILLTVDATEKELSLKIADNGKGIPIEVLNKIRQNTSITQGKTDGHGIGLTQVRQMVAQYKGQFSIDSTVDAGTTVTLTFPRVATPAWMAEKIILTPDNIIVILDDDKSIHTAWDSHLKELLVQYPLIKIHHFTQATDTLAFINNLPESDKAKVFLLTDYELLKQNYNGLDIIAAFPKNNSLLVTSHYANPEIQDKSLLCHTKILPKQLASDIPIQVISAEPQTTEEINYVFVDDDPNFFELAQICYLKNKPVKYYEDPKQFLKEMHHYSKEAKIFLDNRFTNANTTGLLLAEQLHNNGYKKIYLLSCDSFFPGDTPSYITPILKTDTERLKAALQ
jgi:signal transduction histidine kinase